MAAKDRPFLSDIQTIRKRAREHIEQGAVTEAYRGDADVVVKLLNEALATEIVCTLRYKRHYFMAKGIHAEPVAAEPEVVHSAISTGVQEAATTAANETGADHHTIAQAIHRVMERLKPELVEEIMRELKPKK